MICYFFSLLVNIWVKFIMPKFNTQRIIIIFLFIGCKDKQYFRITKRNHRKSLNNSKILLVISQIISYSPVRKGK